MAGSKTDIANLALSHLGVDKDIADLDDESSQEAAACRRFYTETRDEMLRTYPWPFARKFATLALVQQDPTIEWAFEYQYPGDCVFFKKILSGGAGRLRTASEVFSGGTAGRIDVNATRVPYHIAEAASGKSIYTDREDACAEYTSKATDDVSRWPADFVMALSLRLAVYIAPRVSGGDPFRLGDRSFDLWQRSISLAGASAFNEQQDDPHPESEFSSVR